MLRPVQRKGASGIGPAVAAPIIRPVGLVGGVIGVGQLVVFQLRHPAERDPQPAPAAEPLARQIAVEVLVEQAVVPQFVGGDLLVQTGSKDPGVDAPADESSRSGSSAARSDRAHVDEWIFGRLALRLDAVSSWGTVERAQVGISEQYEQLGEDLQQYIGASRLEFRDHIPAAAGRHATTRQEPLHTDVLPPAVREEPRRNPRRFTSVADARGIARAAEGGGSTPSSSTSPRTTSIIWANLVCWRAAVSAKRSSEYARRPNAAERASTTRTRCSAMRTFAMPWIICTNEAPPTVTTCSPSISPVRCRKTGVASSTLLTDAASRRQRTSAGDRTLSRAAMPAR